MKKQENTLQRNQKTPDLSVGGCLEGVFLKNQAIFNYLIGIFPIHKMRKQLLFFALLFAVIIEGMD